MKKWTRVMYQPNRPLKEGCYVTASKEHIALSREAAAEGMVLLKNEHNLLPLKAGSRIALFGKGSFDYVKGGGGSGDVTVSYVHNLYDGFQMLHDAVSLYEPLCDFYRANVNEQYDQGSVPGMTTEPALSAELLAGASAYTDTAVIVLSRFSGEGWDRSSIEYNGEYNPWETETSMPKISGEIFPDGDFYLTKEESAMIAQVKQHFSRIAVVLNIGGIIDTSWIKNDDQISSALIAWQGGMEGGLATAELLCGKISPSGKLPDTFAASVDDYPSTADFHESVDYVDYTEDIYVGYRYFETFGDAAKRVCYPFGFGLSYTQFSLTVQSVTETAQAIRAFVLVTNTGDYSGKEVVQMYYSAPQGLLQKPARELSAFCKTRTLLPGESQLLTLETAKNSMASYDDLGKIFKSSYILEKGDYHFYIGTSVRDVTALDYVMTLDANLLVEQLSSKAAPASLKKRLLADGSYEELPQGTANNPNACVFEKMIPGTEEALSPATRGRASCLLLNSYKENAHPLIDVYEGKISLDEFTAQLDDDDLIHLLGGQPNTSVANTYGYGNLPEYGVPNIMTADGPAGLRLAKEYYEDGKGKHAVGNASMPDSIMEMLSGPMKLVMSLMGGNGKPKAGCEIKTQYCTAIPIGTALAQSFDTDFVQRCGDIVGEEMEHFGVHLWLAPALNIHRSIRCGRNFEYYSEDPLVSGKMAAAMTRGVQAHKGCGTTIKHYAANNKEYNRTRNNSMVSERAMREIYLKGFGICVRVSGV